MTDRHKYTEMKLHRNKLKKKKRAYGGKDKGGSVLFSVLYLGIGFIVNQGHAYLLRMIVAPDSWIFGRTIDVFQFLMFIGLVSMLLIGVVYAECRKKQILWYCLTGWILLLFFLSSFYFYGTDNGIYYHQLFSGRKISWEQMQSIKLQIKNRRQHTYLEYKIMTKDHRKIEINYGLDFGSLEDFDSLLESKNVKYEASISKDDLKRYIRGLDDYEKAILVKHYPDAALYISRE